MRLQEERANGHKNPTFSIACQHSRQHPHAGNMPPSEQNRSIRMHDAWILVTFDSQMKGSLRPVSYTAFERAAGHITGFAKYEYQMICHTILIVHGGPTIGIVSV